MKFEQNYTKNLKVSYIGGGSRGWAWTFMRELARAEGIGGEVALYDIDYEAAKKNEIIGNKFNDAEGAVSFWKYKATETIGEALKGSDFVIISIMPGTFDEMESDVHTPEKYGIYQSVGDTVGPGGIIRSMRTVPMFEYIAEQIREHCPNAWIINFTNPMTLCVKTLYRVFPEIKAYGCCHEVFGTQKMLMHIVKEKLGITDIDRNDIKVNPVAVNHFTWLTSAKYKNIDLYPLYREFCEEHPEGIVGEVPVDSNWFKVGTTKTAEKVKMDLFKRFGVIAAAGDRHLAEFCEGKWYLENPERVDEMGFALTPVEGRRQDLKERLEESDRLLSGEEKPSIFDTGEEGVNQMRALLGLGDMVTNVNIPNVGQIPNLPIGAIVETNAVFRDGTLTPVFAGNIPKEIYPMVSRICGEQEMLSQAIAERDLDKIFQVFSNDPLVTCSLDDAKKLFDEMVQNTKEYLTMFNI